MDSTRAASGVAGAAQERGWQHNGRVLLAAGFIALVITAVMLIKLGEADFKDAEVWWNAGRRVLAGETVVGIRDYRYPPAFAVMISPLAAAPLYVFCFTWYLVNLGLFVVSLRLAVQLVNPASSWSELPRYWLPVLLVAVFAIDNLFLGQTNVLVMLLVYWALLEVSRKREWLAGIPLAGAIAVKVFPATLIGYLAYRLRVKAVVATVAASLLFMLVVPAPVRGARRNYEETRAWWVRVVEPYLSRGKAGDWGQHALDFGNQSLQAVAHRYLTNVNAYVIARDPQRSLYVNFADLTPKAVNLILLALFAALGVSFVAASGLRRPSDRLQQATEYSLAVILVLLVSALSWTYFFVMLLLPIATALTLLARGSLRPGTAWMLKAGLVASGLAAPLLMSSYARALGHVFWATMVLYVGLAMACWDLRRARTAA